jgi:hypothetical protein
MPAVKFGKAHAPILKLSEDMQEFPASMLPRSTTPTRLEKRRSGKMAIQFREEINYQGLSGITVMTFRVIAYENLQQDDCKRHGGKPPVSLADEMRYSDKNYVWFPNPYSGTVNRVTFEELMREYEGMDFENAFLQISTRFRANRPF